jgi:hypothetical protein
MTMSDDQRRMMDGMTVDEAQDAFELLQSRTFPYNLYRNYLRRTTADVSTSIAQLARYQGTYVVGAKPGDEGTNTVQVYIPCQVMDTHKMRDLALWAIVISRGILGADIYETENRFNDTFPV